MTNPLTVAVIGAGAAGLVTARELLRENHRVTVFEKSDQLGGTWVYDPRVDSNDHLINGVDPDPNPNLNPNRASVHSSLYSSLRTNLPRQIMGFSDYSFDDKFYGDPRRFPGHEEVLKFLRDFANSFGLGELIRFNSEVVRVDSMAGGDFMVEWRRNGVSSEEVFDAVVVCNGHHTVPRVAFDIPGIKKWPRKQVHSHNYRVPEPYRDQVVVMIGSGPSAFDLSREISTVAKEVHLSSRSPNVKVSKMDGYANIWQHSKIVNVFDDGMVAFEDGFSVEADTIFHCTGYKFDFPFLTTDIVSVEDNRVGPLYKHVFPPRLAPRLSFIGLTFNQGLVFRMFETQAKWVAKALSGKISLPPEAEMLADAHEANRQMEVKGIPKHQTHSLNFQFEYIDWVADQVGFPVEDELKEICRNLIKFYVSDPDGTRDKFIP